MVTCYDYTFARLVDRSNVDVVLIGDSLGNVMQGEESTLPVTLDEVIYHTKSVVRGTEQAHVVADLPFMSYQADDDEGMRSAGRVLKESGAQAVKIEGGRRVAPLVDRLTDAGIPVVGHLGLTPQSVHAMGGYRVQGRGEEAREALLEDARALEEAGVYSLVLEMVPTELAAEVSSALEVPTIGIGAGDKTDGQVLVLQDMLGLDPDFQPSFVRRYAEMGESVLSALETYCQEVRNGEFPDGEHSFD
jgi:3-methyl-2-oxobutanoate hydroxymethyltransferase